MDKEERGKKEHIGPAEHEGHTDYHVFHDTEEDPAPNQVNLTAYAIIKYIGLIIITIVVLYFIAAFVLPLIRDLLR